VKKLIAWLIVVGCVVPAMFAEARYYDPETGRFLQEDPEQPGQVRVQGGRVVVIKPSASSMTSQRLNPFVYVRNNPINLIDPYGLLDRGTPEWADAKSKAQAGFGEVFKKAEEKGIECPPIPGKSSEESIDATAEALADEVRPEEWWPKGLGLKFSKKNRDRLEKGLREKHPDWPWAQWDEVRESLK